MTDRDLAIIDALTMIESNARAARENMAVFRVLSKPRLALAGEGIPPDPQPVRQAFMTNLGNVIGTCQALHGLLSNEPKPDTGPKIAG